MIVEIVNIDSVLALEPECNPPVAAYRHSPCALQAPGEGVQPKAGQPHVRGTDAGVQAVQDTSQPRRVVRANAALVAAMEESLKAAMPERLDHSRSTYGVTRNVSTVSRSVRQQSETLSPSHPCTSRAPSAGQASFTVRTVSLPRGLPRAACPLLVRVSRNRGVRRAGGRVGHVLCPTLALAVQEPGKDAGLLNLLSPPLSLFGGRVRSSGRKPPQAKMSRTARLRNTTASSEGCLSGPCLYSLSELLVSPCQSVTIGSVRDSPRNEYPAVVQALQTVLEHGSIDFLRADEGDPLTLELKSLREQAPRQDSTVTARLLPRPCEGNRPQLVIHDSSYHPVRDSWPIPPPHSAYWLVDMTSAVNRGPTYACCC